MTLNKVWCSSLLTVTVLVFAHITTILVSCCSFACDLVPKGVQEKRTEVLENKVDRL